MGDGRRLKEILDEKGTNVRQLAFKTGISQSTLYSTIQKDSFIRFDNALRIANVLGIDPYEICTAVPFSGEISEDELYPTIKDRLGILDNNRVKVYVNSSLLPLLKLYGKNQIQDVDYLLTSFYQLDDEAREEIISSIQVKLKYHKDPKRAKDVKGLKPY